MATVRIRSRATGVDLVKLAGAFMLCVASGATAATNDGSRAKPWDQPIDGTSPIHDESGKLPQAGIKSTDFFGHSYLVNKTCYAVLGDKGANNYDPDHGKFGDELQSWQYTPRNEVYNGDTSTGGKYSSKSEGKPKNNLLMFYHNTPGMKNIDSNYESAPYYAYIHLTSGAFKHGDTMTLVYGPYRKDGSSEDKLGIKIMPVLDACLALADVSKGKSFLGAMTGSEDYVPSPGPPKYSSMSLIRTFAKTVHAMTNLAYLAPSGPNGEIAYQEPIDNGDFPVDSLDDIINLFNATGGKDQAEASKSRSLFVPRIYSSKEPVAKSAHKVINYIYRPYSAVNIYILNLVDTASDSIVYTNSNESLPACTGNADVAKQLCHKEDNQYAEAITKKLLDGLGVTIAHSPDLFEPLHPWYAGTKSGGKVTVPSFSFPEGPDALSLIPGYPSNPRDTREFGRVNLDQSHIRIRDHRADQIETAYYLLYLRPTYFSTIKITPSLSPAGVRSDFYADFYGLTSDKSNRGYNCFSPNYTGDFTYGESTAIQWHKSEGDVTNHSDIREAGFIAKGSKELSVSIAEHEESQNIYRAENDSCGLNYTNIFGRGFVEKLGIISQTINGSFVPDSKEDRDSEGYMRLPSKFSSAYTISDIYSHSGSEPPFQMKPMSYPEWYTSIIHFYLSTADIPEIYNTTADPQIAQKVRNFFKFKANGQKVSFKSSPLFTPDVSCKKHFPSIWESDPRENYLSSRGIKICSPSDFAHPIVSGKFTWFGAPICNVEFSSENDSNYLSEYGPKSLIWLTAAVEASKGPGGSSNKSLSEKAPCVVRNVNDIPINDFKSQYSFAVKDREVSGCEKCKSNPPNLLSRKLRAEVSELPANLEDIDEDTFCSGTIIIPHLKPMARPPRARCDDGSINMHYILHSGDWFDPNYSAEQLELTRRVIEEMREQKRRRKASQEQEQRENEDGGEDYVGNDYDKEVVTIPRGTRPDAKAISVYAFGAVAVAFAVSAGGYAVRRAMNKSRGSGGDDSITCEVEGAVREDNLDGLCWVESLVYENGEQGFGDTVGPTDPEGTEISARSVRI